MRYIDLDLIDNTDAEVISCLGRLDACKDRLNSLTTIEQKKQYIKTHNEWSNFKSILIRTFGNICWYSETDITGSFGDVDHFRPKLSSKDSNGNIILEDGYWWLAYNYKNFRLSCEKCNRSFGEGGKVDYFPLQEGVIPATPESDLEEGILLLDPLNEDDTRLIDFDDNGNVVALSNEQWEVERVRFSNKIYNLGCFSEARRERRQFCKVVLEQYEMAYEANNVPGMENALELLLMYIDDKRPYSSVAKKYISSKICGKPYERILIEHLRL